MKPTIEYGSYPDAPSIELEVATMRPIFFQLAANVADGRVSLNDKEVANFFAMFWYDIIGVGNRDRGFFKVLNETCRDIIGRDDYTVCEQAVLRFDAERRSNLKGWITEEWSVIDESVKAAATRLVEFFETNNLHSEAAIRED